MSKRKAVATALMVLTVALAVVCRHARGAPRYTCVLELQRPHGLCRRRLAVDSPYSLDEQSSLGWRSRMLSALEPRRRPRAGACMLICPVLTTTYNTHLLHARVGWQQAQSEGDSAGGDEGLFCTLVALGCSGASNIEPNKSGDMCVCVFSQGMQEETQQRDRTTKCPSLVGHGS